MEWYLHQINGLPHLPSLLRIGKNLFKIGRNIGSDCLLKSTKISRQHANLHLIENKLLIQDLNTINGTYVNKERLEPMVLKELYDKDLLSFGLESEDQVEISEDRLAFFQVMCSLIQRTENAGSDGEASVCTVECTIEPSGPLATSSLNEAAQVRTVSSNDTHNRPNLASLHSGANQLFKVPRVPGHIKSESGSDSGGVVSSTVNEDLLWLPTLEAQESFNPLVTKVNTSAELSTSHRNSAGPSTSYRVNTSAELSTSHENSAGPSTSHSSTKPRNIKRKHSLDSKISSKKTRYYSSSSDDDRHHSKKDKGKHINSTKKSADKSKPTRHGSSGTEKNTKNESENHKSSESKRNSSKNKQPSVESSENLDKTNEKTKDDRRKSKESADKKTKSKEKERPKDNKKSEDKGSKDNLHETDKQTTSRENEHTKNHKKSRDKSKKKSPKKRRSSTTTNDFDKPPSSDQQKPSCSSSAALNTLNKVSISDSVVFDDVTTNVIEISSSDDEDIFASSQLFNRYNSVENPPLLDPIKMEMEALMGDAPQEVPALKNESIINLEEFNNFCGFDSTQQICDVLEDGANTLSKDDPLDAVLSADSEVEMIFELPSEEDSRPKDPVSVSNENPEISLKPKDKKISKHKNDAREVQKNSNSTKIENFTIATTSFFNSSKTLSKAPSDDWQTKKNSPGTSTERKRAKTVLGKRIIKKDEKSFAEKIKEERRKKLKDLAEKNSKELSKEKKKGTVPKTMPESKTFRGGFLLEEGPKTPKRVTKSNPSVPEESNRSLTRSKSLSNLRAGSEAQLGCSDVSLAKAKKPEVKKMTRRKSVSAVEAEQNNLRSVTPAADSPHNDRRRRCKSVSLDRSFDINNRIMTRARSKTPVFDRMDYNVQERQERIPLMRNCSICPDEEPRYNFRQRVSTPLPDTSLSRPASRMEVDSDEDILLSQNYNPNIMWGVGPSTSAPEKYAVPEIWKIDVQDVILKMVAWSPYWIAQQVPPVVPARQMPLVFENMIEYEETLTSLMLLEIWQHCYQSQQPKSANTDSIRAAYIEHTRVNGNILNIDCESYTSNEDYKKNLLPKFEDLALYEYTYREKCSDGSINKTVSTKFAYVSRINKRPIKDTDKIKSKLAQYCSSPDWLIEYTLNVFHRPGKEPPTKSFIILKPLLNIGGFLKMIKAVKNLRTSPLCSKILKPKIGNYRINTTHTELICPLTNETLNAEQLQVVLEGASLCTNQKPGILCITGPPGTGKSTVIINLVLQILFSNETAKILLVAPSNTAVDNILLKLVSAKDRLPLGFDKNLVKQIRVGPENYINPSVKKYSLQNLANDMMLQSLKNHSRYDSAVRNHTTNQLIIEAYGNRYGNEFHKAQNTLLKNCSVVCTTLNSCVTKKITDLVYSHELRFDCCIIDEATQCHEVESLLPTLLGIDKFVLVGDPKQLHATVLNREAQSLGFDRSLFSRIAENFSADPRSPIRTLITQYRMHEEICQFPNKAFYDGLLRSEPRVRSRIPSTIRPYLVFNITAKPKEPPKESYVNVEEVHLIKMLLSTIFHMIDLSHHTYTVGIITPYNNQKNLINTNIADLKLNSHIKVTVNTVDSFQGMENDIVIISCVRESTNSFLQNVNRLNVALTRAKQALYIIGNYTLFKECKTLYDLREDAKKRKVLLDIKQDPTTISNFQKYLLKH